MIVLSDNLIVGTRAGKNLVVALTYPSVPLTSNFCVTQCIRILSYFASHPVGSRQLL